MTASSPKKYSVARTTWQCIAQDRTAAVDAYIESEMRQARIPGVSIAVIKEGTIVLAKGYGLANVEHQVPVKPETIFQSGSTGKQFTSTLIMMLIEEGKIALDDKLGKFFSEGPEAWRNITIRQLLSHSGGMTDHPPDFDMRRDYTDEELLRRAAALPLAFEPGQNWRYSNVGYLTLGLVVRKVTGKFYGDAARDG